MKIEFLFNVMILSWFAASFHWHSIVEFVGDKWKVTAKKKIAQIVGVAYANH